MTVVEAAIKIIEENLKKPVFAIRPMDGDHENYLFLVNYEYVLRIGKKNPVEEPFHAQQNEYKLYAALSKKGLAAPIAPFLFYSSHRDKVEYILNGCPLDPRGTDIMMVLPAVVEAIVAFHALSIDVGPFDPFARFRHYKKGNRKPLPESFEQRVLKRFNEIYESRPLVLSHNRLTAENVFTTEEGIRFADLSFVGMNTPLFDLASFVEENELPSPLARQCLMHFSRLSLESPFTYQELEATVLFLDALWYYYGCAMYKTTKEKRYAERAERKKKRFLFAFEANLMEDKE